MKYIRTKDERILIIIKPSEFDEEERRKIPNDCTMVKSNNIFGCSIVENENIIKQADTIEELCDEFVVAYEDGARIVYGDLEWAKVKAKASLELGNKSIIYGAIWTEWGLKYVAKMNDKGELELL